MARHPGLPCRRALQIARKALSLADTSSDFLAAGLRLPHHQRRNSSTIANLAGILKGKTRYEDAFQVATRILVFEVNSSHVRLAPFIA
jgi:hypothetical protein